MRDVYIAGTGMTAFGKFMDSSVRKLAEEATAEALRDAHAAPSDIEMAFFSNATAGILTGQEMIRGQVALRNTGVLGVPIVNVENACASAVASSASLRTLESMNFPKAVIPTPAMKTSRIRPSPPCSPPRRGPTCRA